MRSAEVKDLISMNTDSSYKSHWVMLVDELCSQVIHIKNLSKIYVANMTNNVKVI